MVHCKFSLNLPLFGLGLSFKGHGLNLWFSTNTIILFYIWTFNLKLSFKEALSYFEGSKDEFYFFYFWKWKITSMEVDHNITRELASTYLKVYTKIC